MLSKGMIMVIVGISGIVGTIVLGSISLIRAARNEKTILANEESIQDLYLDQTSVEGMNSQTAYSGGTEYLETAPEGTTILEDE